MHPLILQPSISPSQFIYNKAGNVRVTKYCEAFVEPLLAVEGQ